MKTKIYTSVLAILFAILFTVQSFATEFNFKEEAYINDIRFSTEMIFSNIMNPEFNFEEEAFINDIPFNTALLVDFEMEETFIDDIPFSTDEIVAATFQKEFQMEEETYIDDIPFSTECIAQQAYLNFNQLFAAK